VLYLEALQSRHNRLWGQSVHASLDRRTVDQPLDQATVEFHRMADRVRSGISLPHDHFGAK
jgi:hypothetical protein